MVLKAFGLLVASAETQPGLWKEWGLLTDAFPLVCFFFLFFFWLDSLSERWLMRWVRKGKQLRVMTAEVSFLISWVLWYLHDEWRLYSVTVAREISGIGWRWMLWHDDSHEDRGRNVLCVSVCVRPLVYRNIQLHQRCKQTPHTLRCVSSWRDSWRKAVWR